MLCSNYENLLSVFVLHGVRCWIFATTQVQWLYPLTLAEEGAGVVALP